MVREPNTSRRDARLKPSRYGIPPALTYLPHLPYLPYLCPT